MYKLNNKYTVSSSINIGGEFNQAGALGQYKAGDTYVYDRKNGMFTCRKETEDMISTHMINPDIMETLIDWGFVYPVYEETVPTRESEINRLLGVYRADFIAYKDSNNREGLTVAANMIKVLNHLKSLK